MVAVRVVIDGRRLGGRPIHSMVQLRIRETLLLLGNRRRQADRVSRMVVMIVVIFRLVDVEGTVVFNRRFELRFGDGIDAATIPVGWRHERFSPGTGCV